MPTQSPSPHLPFGENKNAAWYGKDIISVKQFSRADLEYVFGVAHECAAWSSASGLLIC